MLMPDPTTFAEEHMSGEQTSAGNNVRMQMSLSVTAMSGLPFPLMMFHAATA